MSDARIVHWIPGADLRNGHMGLHALAKKELKVDVDKLRVGECVLFINSGWTAFKVYCANNIVLHYRHPHGHKLNARAVLEVPRFMRGGSINYKESLRNEILTRRYPNKDITTLEGVHSLQ